jgi:hypothetical protein
VATREPGVWFTHNDSGDSARFFALGPSGRTLATYELDGVKAVDWEDMAAAPLGGVPTLWFADIGDNDGSRPDVSVYAVREPAVFPGASGVTVHVKAVRYRFRYPDGPRDAETLMVDPRSSRIYIASKALDGDSHLYVAPAHPSTRGVNELSDLVDVQWVPRAHGLIADLAMQVLTTGGAFAPDGRSFALRTYTDAYLFRMDGTGPLAVARAGVSEPLRIVLPDQMQGEGISFRRDGKALVISSEHMSTAVDEVLLPRAALTAAAARSPSAVPATTSLPSAATAPTTAGSPGEPSAGPASASPAPASRSASPPPTSARLGTGHGGSALPGVAGAVLVGALAAAGLVARRRRAGSARSSR